MLTTASQKKVRPAFAMTINKYKAKHGKVWVLDQMGRLSINSRLAVGKSSVTVAGRDQFSPKLRHLVMDFWNIEN